VTASFDVLVVGGGPAGLAVAGALRQRGRSVAVFERTTYDGARVGETLGPEVGPLLRSLGAWDALQDLFAGQVGQVPFRAVRSAWGSATLEERPSILHPLGEGWHVDRARFDGKLAAWASSRGASMRAGAGSCSVARIAEGFRVEPASGEAAEGRFFVDASGRGAPARAGLHGRRWLAFDRQVALIARTLGSAPGPERDLLLEAAEEGWWYSAPQPDGTLVVTLVTDADLVPAGGRSSLPARFRAALDRTSHTRARVAGLALAERVQVVRADCGRLLPDRGAGWRAVGDAAMGGDPLEGHGVARALRSGLEAAAEIDGQLAGREEPEPAKPDVRFAAYLDRRAELYLLEGRWPDARFWARRRPTDRGQPLTLDPEAILERAGGPARELASVEAMIPPRALATLLSTVERPQPAHAAMASLKAAAPVGDRRLILGLQLLVARGAIVARAPEPTA
jgi:flavin-dependent dehydrogenase